LGALPRTMLRRRCPLHCFAECRCWQTSSLFWSALKTNAYRNLLLS